MKLARPSWLCRAFDTLAVLGERFSLAADRRKAALGRIEAIWDEDAPGLREAIGALFMLGQGLWFALPFDTFTVTKAFRAVALFSTEGFWALAFCVLVALRLDALLVDDRRAREFWTLVAVVLWTTLGLALILGNPTSPGGIAYISWAVAEGLTFRAGRIKGNCS